MTSQSTTQAVKAEATKELEGLLQLAVQLGAGGARLISAADISIEDDLAELCRKPQCESYGCSPSCPPHVSGPTGFRKLLTTHTQAVVFKIEVPANMLFSSERRGIFALLHEIAAGVEQAVIDMGYVNSKGYAGGSCKRIFCHEHPNCRVLHEGGPCRSPDRARPSMSGFGINVSKLMKAAGWTLHRKVSGTESEETSLATVCGLVLIG
jgi:predicted metal-binding protein